MRGQASLMRMKGGDKMGDYKYGIFCLADEYAEEKYGVGFYELNEKQQDEVWKSAERDYWDSFYSEGDRLWDELRHENIKSH